MLVHMGMLPNSFWFVNPAQHFRPSLLALKSTDHTVIQSSAQTMLDITRGVRMNESFCAQWDIPLEGLTSLKESITTTAYGNFIIDAGLRGDDLALTVALMPCLLGYGEAALWLRKEAECEASDIYLEANPYRRWVPSFPWPLCISQMYA